jgi:ClpA/ClpB-like protein
MFERYTEKARRTIFFARYEASHCGSPYIETEHILLGLLRENRELGRLLPTGSGESIRNQIDAHTIVREKVSTSVDLPLSNESKRVLAYGAEEAERLAHRHIGTEHLFLGLLRERGCFAADILRERGLTLEKLREHFASISPTEISTPPRFRPALPVEIHGKAWSAETIRDRVRVLQRSNWYWQKRPWKARDLAVQEDGKMSFDVSLAVDTRNFSLRQAGWKGDECAICGWELFESENQPKHGTGYTNGRDWICTECYEKFLKGPDFFATAHPEVT